MNNILITGGAGYIGSVLVKKLSDEGYKCFIFDNYSLGTDGIYINKENQPLYLKGDITEKKGLKELSKIINQFDIDTTIHLAAKVYTGEHLFKDIINKVNYEGTKNVVNLCKEYGTDLIFTSTCSNYGISKGYAKETSELKPLSPYAISKVISEEYILRTYPRAIILRLATAFGFSPKMRFDLLINEMVLKAWYSQPIKIYSPRSWRPYIHIEDIANAIKTCLYKNVRGEIYNVGSTKMNYTKESLCNEIQKHICDAKFEEVQQSGDNRDYLVSFDKIQKELNFNTKIDLEEGIKGMIWAIRKTINNPFDKKYNNVLMYNYLHGGS